MKCNIVFDLLKTTQRKLFRFQSQFWAVCIEKSSLHDIAEIISVSIAVLGRMHREVIFTRHSIAIIIHFSLETLKKFKRTTDTYLCLSVSSLWTNLASSRMCDWNRNSLPLFGGRSKLYNPCNCFDPLQKRK